MTIAMAEVKVVGNLVEEVVDEVGEVTAVEDSAPVVGAGVVVVDEVGEVTAVEDAAPVVGAGVVVQGRISAMTRQARIFWLKDPTDDNYSCSSRLQFSFPECLFEFDSIVHHCLLF